MIYSIFNISGYSNSMVRNYLKSYDYVKIVVRSQMLLPSPSVTFPVILSLVAMNIEVYLMMLLFVFRIQ